MRTFLITLTALAAAAVAVPAVTANAQDRTVVITKHHDRGLHRGWTHGHHYGWRNHNAKVVVVKKGRHHHYD